MYGIFTYIWLIFMVNLGKYTSPMDAMGSKLPYFEDSIFPPKAPPPNKIDPDPTFASNRKRVLVVQMHPPPKR